MEWDGIIGRAWCLFAQFHPIALLICHPVPSDTLSMDLSASTLISSLLIGSLGGFLLLYGKRAERPLLLVIGGAMCVYPYFLTNPLTVWLVTLLLLIPIWTYRHG